MVVEMKYKEVGDHVEIPKEEFERVRATMETLQNKEAMKRIEKGLRDIGEGRVHDWEDVKKEIHSQ